MRIGANNSIKFLKIGAKYVMIGVWKALEVYHGTECSAKIDTVER